MSQTAIGKPADRPPPTAEGERNRAAVPDGARYDLILVGGGLANGLLAYRLRQTQPDLKLLLIEKAEHLGGDHTWSFHATDITAEQMAWVAPFIVKAWPRQEVRFPGYERVIETGYRSANSDAFRAVLNDTLGDAILTGVGVQSIEGDRVQLDDQRVLRASCVVDGRGAIADPSMALGFQKFVGLEVDIDAGHGQEHPIIMDATVPQNDGYRFMYTLPFSPTRILIEDTYYSDGDDLADDKLHAEIEAYAAKRGWEISRIVRQEAGILPIVLAGDIDTFWQRAGAVVPRAGLRAGLFHPVTGYSLPDAVRLADRLAGRMPMTSSALASEIAAYAKTRWRSHAFFRLLNRMLFIAATPTERVRVMQRFYGLSRPLIERFYAGQPLARDKARVLTGKPPVPLGKAVTCLTDHRAWTFAAHNRSASGAP
ncbi:MAG: lycopene beta-cyclase CrtY [Pseudomonadota bacterium]